MGIKEHKTTRAQEHKLMVKVGKMVLKNPIIVASGTFGYGRQMKDFIDINALGGIITKTITLKPRVGNPVPRIVETPSGMLNSIGLENDGLQEFILNKVPFLEKVRTNIIVSISGFSIDEFEELSEKLSGFKCISGIELNLSCPNISHRSQVTSHKLIAQDKLSVGKIVKTVRKRTKLTLITKLTPNVTDIKEIAKAAEGAGSDALSLINTVFGMSVNHVTRKPNLANVIGGLSGPAIKPIALYFVNQVYQTVKIPIIGIGGIMKTDDALQFMICGAKAVQVGTANFVNPSVAIEIIDGIMQYAKKNSIKNIKEIIGSLG